MYRVIGAAPPALDRGEAEFAEWAEGDAVPAEAGGGFN
jgi:hypothetical protein